MRVRSFMNCELWIVDDASSEGVIEGIYVLCVSRVQPAIFQCKKKIYSIIHHEKQGERE